MLGIFYSNFSETRFISIFIQKYTYCKQKLTITIKYFKTFCRLEDLQNYDRKAE